MPKRIKKMNTAAVVLSPAELLVIKLLRGQKSSPGPEIEPGARNRARGQKSSPGPEIEPPVQRTRRPGKFKFAKHWHTDKKTCPRCEKVGTVADDFGVVIKRGVERAQSWCRECRASVSYYSATRKNTRRSPPLSVDH